MLDYAVYITRVGVACPLLTYALGNINHALTIPLLTQASLHVSRTFDWTVTSIDGCGHVVGVVASGPYTPTEHIVSVEKPADHQTIISSSYM